MRKRSSYRPKGVNPTAYKIGMHGAAKLDTTDKIKFLSLVRESVDELIASRPSTDAWRDVFDCINLMESFSALGIIKRGGKEFVASIQAEIVGAVERQKSTGSNVLRPVEITAIKDMIEAYADVLEIITCREYFQAAERVKRKVSQALAMGSHGSVKVLEAA